MYVQSYVLNWITDTLSMHGIDKVMHTYMWDIGAKSFIGEIEMRRCGPWLFCSEQS